MFGTGLELVSMCCCGGLFVRPLIVRLCCVSMLALLLHVVFCDFGGDLVEVLGFSIISLVLAGISFNFYTGPHLIS